MAAKKCPDRYYTRMEAAGDDKLKIAQFINADDTILDVGAGGGALSELLLEKFPNIHITALDSSDTAVSRLKALAERYPGRLEVIQTDFFRYEPDVQFDDVVFCSSLHEIFSYTECNGKRFDKDVITFALDHAASMLKENKGKIIIRDGVAARYNPKVLVKYRDPDTKKLAARYEAEFKGFPLNILHTTSGDIMPYNSMMELLYTITWGEESFPREVQEWYGYFTLNDWEREEPWLSVKHKLFLSHVEKYLQPGYKEHLKDKVLVQSAPRPDWDGKVCSKPIEFPASNCLVVFERVC
ncbi:methyltransferase domain-containing protein [Candidatus Allofournierella merdipullorum]|uniref:methyltransferase domain-containing protein n=1 Tax=Candidatus Allofournierella merdipullorum TaxID=2838595 RepID=UPI00374EC2E3